MLVLIQHEIVPENLEILGTALIAIFLGRGSGRTLMDYLAAHILLPDAEQPALGGLECQFDLPLDLRKKLIPVHPALLEQVLQGQDVALLILPVGLAVFLDRVVGQVRVVVCGVDVVLLAGCPDVAFLEEVVLLAVGHQSEHPDVKFPLAYQERSLYVFLDNEAPLFVPAQLCFQEIPELLDCSEKMDSPAPVQIRRLEQPQRSPSIDIRILGRDVRTLLLEGGHIDERIAGFEFIQQDLVKLLDLFFSALTLMAGHARGLLFVAPEILVLF